MTDQTVQELVAESGDQPAAAPEHVAAAQEQLEPLVIKLDAVPDRGPEAREVPEDKPKAVSAPVAMPEPDLGSTGLELVETHSEPTVEEEEEATPASPSRRRRKRGRGSAPVAAEPLVMVETRDTVPAQAESTQPKPDEWGPPSNPRRRARPQHTEQPAEPLVMVETRSADADDNKAA